MLNSLSEEMKQMEQSKANTQVELKRHQEKVEQLDAKLVSSLQETQSLKSQLVVVHSNHKRALAESTENTKQLETLQQEKNQLQHKLETSQEMVNELNAALVKAGEDKKKILKVLHSTETDVVRDVSTLQRELGQLIRSVQRYSIHMYSMFIYIIYYSCKY